MKVTDHTSLMSSMNIGYVSCIVNLNLHVGHLLWETGPSFVTFVPSATAARQHVKFPTPDLSFEHPTAVWQCLLQIIVSTSWKVINKATGHSPESFSSTLKM